MSIGIFAQIPNGYYDDAAGLSGAPLKSALFGIIDNHDVQSYGSIWIHFESTDPKPNGKVWDMYSDIPGGNPPYEFNFGDDQCGNYSGEGDCYNREHSFPKSWFNDASPMYSDLFQIVPTDGYVNGQRSNWPYGEVNNPSWTSQNGSKVGNNSTSGYSGTVFEPRDEYKGDFARIYFYMATRYENLIAGWENNSSNSDAALDGTSYPCYEDWYLDLLLDWHQNDPVSQKELDRNNEIYDIQDNRNPYVDHPEYVNMVWGGVQVPLITNVNWSPNPPDENVAVNVNATITDDGNINIAQLLWGYSSGNLNNSLNMSHSGTTYSGTIPGQSAGQMVYFKISATDNESNNSQSAIYNYQVNENAGTIALPFLEDFNDQTLGIFMQYSVTGPNEYWHNDDFEGDYYAKMSNYNGSENLENEDWMITPAINFDNYSNEKLQFISAMKDFSDQNTFLYLLYSSNYSGSGNPNNANWIDISNQAIWSPGDYEWTNSGEISLNGISGNSVYVAFKYISQSGSGKTWQIEDVSITLDGSSNNPPQITNVDHTPTIPAPGQIVNVSATITDDGSITSAQLKWGLSASNLNNTVNMSASGSSYSAIIPGQSEGVTVYFQIVATDNESATSQSSVYQYSVAGNQAPVISNINYEPTEPVSGEAVDVSATITDDGSIESALILWGLSASNLSNILEMNVSGNIYSEQIPGQNEGITVYFKIQAFDDLGEMTESNIYNYSVQTSVGYQSLPFMETFEAGDLGIFHEYNVSGPNQSWHNDDFDDNLYAKMSNYNGSVNLENEDWLLTTAINFNAYENEVLNFRSAMQDYDDFSTFLYLKYSTNYDGTSDPNSATWIDISNQANWSEGDYQWIESGDIDLSGIDGSTVYLAFQYVSEDGSGKTWHVDNISVTLEGANQSPEITEITRYPEYVDNSNEVNIYAVITDDVEVSSTSIFYGLSPTQMINEVTMSASGDDYTGIIPPQEAFETVYYRIKATDNEGAITYSNIYNYFVDLLWGLEETTNSKCKLVPNPAKNYVYILLGTNTEAEIKIFHSSGSLVQEFMQYDQKQGININNLSPGVYFVHINLSSDHQVIPMIVE